MLDLFVTTTIFDFHDCGCYFEWSTVTFYLVIAAWGSSGFFGGINYYKLFWHYGWAFWYKINSRVQWIQLCHRIDGEKEKKKQKQTTQVVCDLCRVKQVERVFPLQLTGGAFAVYLLLSQEGKTDATWIKKALCTAFATDAFIAHKEFMRSLQPGETVDIYLAWGNWRRSSK